VSESFEVEPTPVEGNTVIATAAPKKRNPLDLLLIGAAVVALAGVAFAGGRLTAPAASATTAGNGGNGTAGTGGNGGAGRFGPNASFRPDGSFQPGGGFAGGGGGPLAGGSVAVTGSVVAVSATEITLQLSNGTTVNIPIDSSTAYHTQGSASSSDVKTGTKVQVEVSGGAVRGPGGGGGGTGGGGTGGGTAGASPAPNASGTPRQLGPASSVTIIP